MTDTAALWAEFSSDLRAFLRRRVGSEAVADDLVQEVFARVHARSGAWPDADRIGPWIFRIARNLAVDHHRRPRTAPLEGPLEERFEAATHDAADSEDDASEQRRLERGLGAWLRARVDELPEPYREAVLLAEVDGLTQRDIAAQLGLPYGTVKSRVQRGRAQLARELERCCRVERDRRGGVIGVEPRAPRCPPRGC